MRQKDYRKYAEYLEDLQNMLDGHRRQRSWLAASWAVWILLVLMLVGFQVTEGFSIILMLVILVPLLPLLIQTRGHLQFGAALEAEVKRLPYRELAGDFDAEKPKNQQALTADAEEEKAPYFTIGDDGELVELPPEQQRKKS